MEWPIVVDLVKALAWPLVVGAIFMLYHRPLGEFIQGLGGRVTKLSVFEVSIELVALPEPPSPWSDSTLPQKAEIIEGNFSSTNVKDLLDGIGLTNPVDYLVVDIKDGQFWLISRVYIFTVLLQALRGTKCIVFVETKGEFIRRLIGIASPEAVRSALGQTYDWFESALGNAMIIRRVHHLHPSLDAMTAGNVAASFIQDSAMRKTNPTSLTDGWTQLPRAQGIWEHTQWMTLERVCTDLGQTFYERDLSRYEDLPDTAIQSRTRALLSRKEPFIAIVNSKCEFQRLLDRQKLLEQIVQSL